MSTTMDLEQDFRHFIQQHHLIRKQERILLAVSGGIDSMVLCHLFKSLETSIAIAHCNFQMRGDASDLDEDLVRTLALRLEVPFHVVRFETKSFAKQHKLGIQEAARNLRYTWFSDIMERHGYSRLATAHHQDDQIETVLLNIARGTGIYGLQGMQPLRDHIIRPLLFARKVDIKRYARREGIAYREDASNEDVIYRRNFIRHKLIPNIEQVYPSFRQRMSENIKIWQKSGHLLRGFLEQQLDRCKKMEQDSIVLEVHKIESSLRDLITYEWLKPYGFHFQQVEQMLRSLDAGRSGKVFYTQHNQVLTDRKKLILTSKDTPESNEILISRDEQDVHLDEGSLYLTLLAEVPSVFDQEPEVAYLDVQQLDFPLTIRRWQHGDYFYPLGLEGKKQKLKKLFNNLKMSRLEKSRQWLLTSGEDICWVIGQRIDHRFRLTEASKYVLRLTWVPN